MAWKDIAKRFCDPRDCLASYVALESAEVLAGVKPANLLSISDRTNSCGRNPYRLWKAWGKQVLDATPLQAHELADRGHSVLVLLYQPEALKNLLLSPAIRAILHREGYADDLCLTGVLDKLTESLAAGVFPHEIGMFLGYPLKDVAGFMGLARIPFTCQGPWKMYGDPRNSLRLAETFRSCRARMATDLACCSSPYECLSGNSYPGRSLFLPHI
ncbi:DUF3793 family protein [Geobacter sp. AOG1]|uniref:DUF3793 family protein n=1 Tax=Geobacter sp. AOG1 TaxID=1566346 RepID=UPI001CC74718|nr:DUF3793 family protein [Geobacter sp. AOG1]